MLRRAPAISLLMSMGLVAACSPRMPAATSQPAIANPASEYCVQHGGTIELRTVSGSVVGVCTFADASECEEWQFFRGECLPASSPATPVEVQSPTLTLDSLKDARYHSPDWGDFQLIAGVFHRPPSVPGESPETNLTQLIEPVVYGDLDADGLEDAVVFLSTQAGGTGHFREMAAMLNRGGQPFDISTVTLGDRVVIESALTAGGIITLGMRVHGPDDPLCCPSQSETWRYQLQGAQLVRLP